MKDWYDRNFYWVDLVICAALMAVAVFICERWIGRVEVDRITAPNRQALYTAVASTAGALLGFIVAAASILVPLGALPQFSILRQSGHYRSVFNVYWQAMFWLALATVGAFAGLLFDTTVSANVIVMYVIGFLFLAAGARVFQCIRLLNMVVGTMLNTPESAYPRST